MFDVTWHLLTLGCYGSFGYCDTTEALQAATELRSDLSCSGGTSWTLSSRVRGPAGSRSGLLRTLAALCCDLFSSAAAGGPVPGAVGPSWERLSAAVRPIGT